MPVTLSSLGAKTMRRLTLTSGTSWTVPAGVTFVNVTLVGGGGGGGVSSDFNTSTASTNGGTTTFTGATSAVGGNGGLVWITYNGSVSTVARNGVSAVANSGKAGIPSYLAPSGTSIAMPFNPVNNHGTDGTMISSTLSVTPGASIAYAIGAGGTGGVAGANGGGPSANGGNGGSGRIDIEYWV